MEKYTPAHISSFPPAAARGLHYLFSDIDGTITANGMLPAASYQALWQLTAAGIDVVMVTGRPAGWCDLIARYWPVAGVIGENGSFYYRYDRQARRMERVHLIAQAEREAGRRKLEKIRLQVAKAVPRCQVAADQAFRSTDLALDYCEDVVPPLAPAEIEEICRIVKQAGAVYKISDIHINCWYGAFDKLTCAREFVSRHSGCNFDALLDNMVYIGDSPNDEPMFKAVPYSIGVANINHFLPQMQYPPAYITGMESAAGFAEAAAQILGFRT